MAKDDRCLAAAADAMPPVAALQLVLSSCVQFSLLRWIYCAGPPGAPTAAASDTLSQQLTITLQPGNPDLVRRASLMRISHGDIRAGSSVPYCAYFRSKPAPLQANFNVVRVLSYTVASGTCSSTIVEEQEISAPGNTVTTRLTAQEGEDYHMGSAVTEAACNSLAATKATLQRTLYLTAQRLTQQLVCRLISASYCIQGVATRFTGSGTLSGQQTPVVVHVGKTGVSPSFLLILLPQPTCRRLACPVMPCPT